MDLYFEMLRHPTFTIEDVLKYYDNVHTARSAVAAQVKNNRVRRIRNNLYTCVSGETGEPVSDRYQIACAINPAAYVSHHTAMEYYGVCNQVCYEVHVSSERRFRDFSFDGYDYRCLISRCATGIESVRFGGGIRVTSRERTVVDCIKDMDFLSGMEEVLENLSGLGRLSAEKLLVHLREYDNQFLYQKTGYILHDFRNETGLSESFFDICKAKAGQSKRYLSSGIGKGRYVNEWKLVVPAESGEDSGD